MIRYGQKAFCVVCGIRFIELDLRTPAVVLRKTEEGVELPLCEVHDEMFAEIFQFVRRL